jgi:hypothetical protein
MRFFAPVNLLAAALVIALPSVAQAGPPLICHPIQTAGGEMLPWGTGPGWNTPDHDYDVQRLTEDTLRLLAADTSVLDRMEVMRRAVIYAASDARVADQLLAAVVARASGSGQATSLALFDAGYLIEAYKQASFLHRRSVTTADGYTLVKRAIAMGRDNAEMEFAAALMTSGSTSAAHLQRARAAAPPLLARNITNLGW